ncbi:hypothetical protein BY996DRAFT_6429461 [Phakopsora pachyrhizi]|nr:hypothetical protein BY996DRAFT_6429461 [Phakopsora pachyrhizi]
MSNPYSSVTVFDSDDINNSKATVQPDDLNFKDFSTSVLPDNLNQDNQLNSQTSNKNGQQVYDPDVELQRRLSNSQSWFSIDSYSPYFDVETKTVLERCWRTMYPKDDYVEVVLCGQPDLYVILFFASSLSGAITAYLNSQQYDYDFSKLSLAVGLIYVYSLGLPCCIWTGMRYWAGVESRTIQETVNLYGYGLTIFIPVALLSIPPISILRSISALIGFSLSVTFLIRNLYPIFMSAPQKSGRVLLILVVILHGIFMMILWFGYLGIGGSIDGISKDKVEDVGKVPSPP